MIYKPIKIHVYFKEKSLQLFKLIVLIFHTIRNTKFS